jgi:hypothetical protein
MDRPLGGLLQYFLGPDRPLGGLLRPHKISWEPAQRAIGVDGPVEFKTR